LNRDRNPLVLLRRALALDDADRRPLARLGPLFAATGASAIVLTSTAKALFLSSHELSALPWMFLGSAAATALASMSYAGLTQRLPLESRFPALILVALVSLAGLRLAFPLNPGVLSVAMAVWFPVVGQLTAMQAWNTASFLLPPRQGKRLFPVLAGLATLGAAVGGALVRGLLRWLPSEDLIWLAAALLSPALLSMRGTLAALASARREEEQSGEQARAEVDGDRSRGAVAAAIQAIWRTPLLLRLAVFVFCLQAAAVLVDYQFAGEMKAHFRDGKDAMASFLGTFYLWGNLAVVLFSLFVAGRMIRVLGVGFGLTLGALALAVGSGLYVLSGALDVPAFWIMVGIAMASHVSQYAFTRNAVQVLVAPLELGEGERARLLIDGVVYRLATVTSSVALLVIGGRLAGLQALSPAVIVAAGVVVAVGVSIGPHYRAVLVAALKSRSVAAGEAGIPGAHARRRTVREVEAQIRDADPRVSIKALEAVAALKLEVRRDLLEDVALHAKAGLARQAILAMQALGHCPAAEVLGVLLGPDRPQEVVRETLRLLQRKPDLALAGLVRPLRHSGDAITALLASAFLIRLQQAQQGRNAPPDRTLSARPGPILAPLASDTVFERVETYSLDLVNLMRHASPQVRREAVEMMGHLHLEEFIEPLLFGLHSSELRPSLLAALLRFGDSVVPNARRMLTNRGLDVVTQVAVLRLLERLASPEACAVVREQVERSQGLVRNEAVTVLWRLGHHAQCQVADREWLAGRVLADLDLLRRYAAMEAGLDPISLYHSFFLEELAAARVQAEGRVFRLLGLLYDRTALYRAWLHYRDPVQRRRSTAVELLDQHVTDPRLKVFVGLIERTADESGRDRLRTMVARRVLPDGTMEQHLEHAEAWLVRAWAFVKVHRRAAEAPAPGDEPVERVFLLKNVPFFAGMSGESLLPLAHAVRRVRVPAGVALLREGEATAQLFVIMDGSVALERGGQRRARMGAGDLVGELALIEGGANQATAVAERDVEALEVPGEPFLNLLDMHPGLAREVLRVLARRMGDVLERAGGHA
jgi:AAA family ATP:ADP antiporter